MHGRIMKWLFFVGVISAALFGDGGESGEIITAGETSPGVLLLISGGLLFLVRRRSR